MDEGVLIMPQCTTKGARWIWLSPYLIQLLQAKHEIRQRTTVNLALIDGWNPDLSIFL